MVNDRKGIAFYLPETRISLDELPDDFFDLSQSEAKMLYQEFVQKRKSLDEKPMMTASMRELQQVRKVRDFLERYKYCVVRIQFSDRSVLQGIFQPSEPFSEVIAFVKSNLRDDLHDFFLFTTPPKVIPNAEKTLLDLNFVPGVKLYFGTPHTHVSTFLREDILVNIRTPDIAAREAQKYRMTKVVSEDQGCEEKKELEKEDKPEELCVCTSNGIKGQEEVKPGPSSHRQQSTASSQNKVPKWFKPNKK